ncbi:MAG: tetratricopeptide repeat protein [Saprospiraceae bacterium]|nr:tetratricopeptide repeat protein [Saprospiraceae bacterium]
MINNIVDVFRNICLGIAVLVIPISGIGQDQNKADSLVRVLSSDELIQEGKIELLHEIASNQTAAEDIIFYANELIKEAEKTEDHYWLHKGMMELGYGYKLKGDLDVALSTFFEGFKAAEEAEYVEGEGTALSNIADTYSINDNHENAIEYYNRALEILYTTDDSVKIATVLLNAGDAYINNGQYEKALEYFDQSGPIFRNLGYLIGTAYNLGNSGMAYAKLGDRIRAEQTIKEAIELLEELEDYYPIAVYLTYMSDIYLEKGDVNTALKYSNRSLTLSEKYGLKDQISDANQQLSVLYERLNNNEKALLHYKNHIRYRDSLNNVESVKRRADMRTEFEVSQKQAEVDLLNQQKRNQQITLISTLVIAFLIALLAIGLYRRYLFTRKTNKIIEEEKNKSDNLLLNILPAETAEELKSNGKVIAQKFESVTIMFTDFKGFSSYAENLSPEELVETVDYYFSSFDEIIDRNGLEKIKTVGDSYMCACGLPNHTPDHALKTVKAAMEIAEFVEKTKLSKEHGRSNFDIRIGIHTGSVVAGVVGTKKFAYDIWGDAVNVASRMESSSDPGRINISEHTYHEIKDAYQCTYRGEVSVKNRGKLKMYFVEKPVEMEKGKSEVKHYI